MHGLPWSCASALLYWYRECLACRIVLFLQCIILPSSFKIAFENLGDKFRFAVKLCRQDRELLDTLCFHWNQLLKALCNLVPPFYSCINWDGISGVNKGKHAGLIVTVWTTWQIPPWEQAHCHILLALIKSRLNLADIFVLMSTPRTGR